MSTASGQKYVTVRLKVESPLCAENEAFMAHIDCSGQIWLRGLELTSVRDNVPEFIVIVNSNLVKECFAEIWSYMNCLRFVGPHFLSP